MIVSKIKSSHILNYNRLNSGYYLNQDAINSRILEDNSDKCVELQTLADVRNPPIFKRQFCEKSENAIHYCQSSDVVNAFEGSDVYVNKIHTLKVGADVSDKQILVTGFGTIGNTRLVNRLSEGYCYANNVCRIDVNNKSLYGYIYALMTSRYGKSQLNKNASGSVVRYIEAPGIKKTLVPILNTTVQDEIHKLIIQSKDLKVDANILLSEADMLFHDDNNIIYEDYHLSESENKKYKSFVVKVSDKTKITLKAKNFSKRITEIIDLWSDRKGKVLKEYLSEDFKIGMRGFFKRIDSDTIGTEMVSQGDLHKSNIKYFKRVIVSRANEEDIANENQVLFPAVGNGSSESEILFRPTLASDLFNGKLLSGDIGRFNCHSKEDAAYLLAVLRSKGGFRIMRSLYYGTQLRRPNWNLLNEINIPMASQESFNVISEKVLLAYKYKDLADVKENEAIRILEKEIEQWEK